MRIKSSIFFVLAALMVACVPAQAITVTVRPDGDIMANSYRGFEQQCTNGWIIDTYNYGWGGLGPWGGSSFNTDQLYSGRHYPGGYGAFLATCDFFQGTSTADKNPSTVWLGTDTWNGQSLVGKTLGDIDEMSYWSFTERIPQRWAGGIPAEVEWWNKNGYWGYVQQPILLEITADSPDGTERRQFWYRPDGTNYVGDDGPRMKGQWYQWNIFTQGKWYTPRSQDITADPDSEEFGCLSWNALMNNSLALQFPLDPAGNTDARIALFKDWMFADPATIWKSGGWKNGSSPQGAPNATGTGMPLNFHVGARWQTNNPLWLQGGTINWSNNTYGFRGQVDGFVLGFNGTSVAFDFEPVGDDVVPEYAYAQKAATGAIVEGAPADRFTMNTAKRSNLFRISGKVTRSNTGTWDNSKRIWQNGYFVVDDGSGLTYQERYNVGGNWVTEQRPGQMFVYVAPRADPLSIYNGDYVAVTGFVEKLRFTESETPFVVWSTPSHVANYSE